MLHPAHINCGSLRFWVPASGRGLLTVAELPSQSTYALAFFPDHRWLVSGGTGRTLRVWSLRMR